MYWYRYRDIVPAVSALLVCCASGINLRDDMGNMSMEISTPFPDAQRYFDQGLRFTSTFKFDYAIASHLAALDIDPECAMCEWGLAIAYGQNLNDALVMALEPSFLANEPLAYQAVARARRLLASNSFDRNTFHARDEALVSALAMRFVETIEEYKSYFVDGLPAGLNRAYAEAMADVATRSAEEGWPDHAMVLVWTADAWMNLSPWDYWEDPNTMRLNAAKARAALEEAMFLDGNNPWAIHLYTHLMEAGAEAQAAVSPSQKLELLVPGAPHLQHMQSHVEFRTGLWHEASAANIRAVALPDSDATYPDHNMDMLMWALGVEGRKAESKTIGQRLTAYTEPRVLLKVEEPLLPPERYLAQEVLHLTAFGDWEGVLALEAPPEIAYFPKASYHYARSLAFAHAGDWEGFRYEHDLIAIDVSKMELRMDYYGIFNAPVLTKVLELLSSAEALRSGLDDDSLDDGVHRLLKQTCLGCKFELPSRHLESAEAAIDTGSGNVTSPPKFEELALLRVAVALDDSLGYDEPPALPLPPRLYLGAALLRSGNVTAAAEAESILAELDQRYPNMGRTLWGLSRACVTLGKGDEAKEFRRRYFSAWQLSEVSLVDSAHVCGQIGNTTSLATETRETPQIEPEDKARAWQGRGNAAVAVVMVACLTAVALRAKKALKEMRSFPIGAGEVASDPRDVDGEETAFVTLIRDLEHGHGHRALSRTLPSGNGSV